MSLSVFLGRGRRGSKRKQSHVEQWESKKEIIKGEEMERNCDRVLMGSGGGTISCPQQCHITDNEPRGNMQT